MNKSELHGWMKELRKFQRDTVYHTIRQIMKNQRFLVADEVGLGKTKIARGVIGFFLSHFKQPIRVVYLCANQQLARQNIQSFRFFEGKNDKESCRSDLRLGLLNWRLGIDQQYKLAERLQLWTLTPGTSFEIQNGSGNMEERAVITGIIDPEQKNTDFQNVMASYSRFGKDADVSKTWNDRWIGQELRKPENLTVISDIRTRVEDYFKDAPHRSELERFRKYYCLNCPQECDCFEQLSQIFIGYAKMKDKLPQRRKDPDYPGAPLNFMRRVLAEIGIDELKPDLIIMDEFQRYDQLLFPENRGNADSEQSLFAHLMKDCSFGIGERKTHFLLLSATPYSTYASSEEEWGCSLDPHKGFIQLMTWLGCNENDLEQCLKKYAESFRREDTSEIEHCKKELEKTLLNYMCRTERRDLDKKQTLENSEFPDSLWKGDNDVIRCAAEEVLRYQDTYQSLQQIGNRFHWHELLNYAKYASRPLSFMQDYKLLETAREKGRAIDQLYYSDEAELKECRDSRIQRILTILGKLKKLLWLPPSNPSRPLAGDFEGMENEGLSKILVFSGWRFVPRMISLVLSAQMQGKDFYKDWEEDYKNNPNSLCELSDGQEPWHPAQALYAAIERYFVRNTASDKEKKSIKKTIVDIVNTFTPEFGARVFCRHSFNDFFKKDFKENRFSAAMIDYCRDGCLEDVFDEYVYMIYKQGNGNIEVLKQYLSTQNLRITRGLQVVFSQENTGKKTSKYMSDCFGEKDVIHDDSEDADAPETAGSMAHLQRAFNSPFAPFVLSTTSIGQEGLDFHWYCRKIIHWNIPDTPVEFEQRNGRINRYHSLSVRQSITAKKDCKNKSWRDIFDEAERDYKDESGIQPHWFISDPRFPTEQFAYYLPGSQDEERLHRVCMQLGIYRVALGQPRQEDFLRGLECVNSLEQYTLCLKPLRGHN